MAEKDNRDTVIVNLLGLFLKNQHNDEDEVLIIMLASAEHLLLAESDESKRGSIFTKQMESGYRMLCIMRLHMEN